MKAFINTRIINARILSVLILTVFVMIVACRIIAQTPTLRHVFDIHAKIDNAHDIGCIPEGRRIIIPITGGEIKGEINGIILPGGADYQLVDTVHNRAALKAIYTIITNDSTIINVTNVGINSYDVSDPYFMTSPKFECDMNSQYKWLNNRIFVCRPVAFEKDGIILRVWETN